MTNRQLAQAFANGATSGKSGNMFIDGDTIYSYGYHFSIATRIHTGLYLINKDRYSNTTARHISHVRQAISGDNIDIIEAVQVDNKLKMDLYYSEQMSQDMLEKANRTRTKHMYELWRDISWDYQAQADIIRQYIRRNPSTLLTAHTI